MTDDTQVTAPPHYAGDGHIECRRAQLSMAAALIGKLFGIW